MLKIVLLSLLLSTPAFAQAQIHTPELDRLRVLVPALAKQRDALANEVVNADANIFQMKSQYDQLLQSLDAEQDAEQDRQDDMLGGLEIDQ